MFHESASRIGELLKQRCDTVAVAESSTGGLISASLLSVAGASAYFLGGSVVYTLASRKAFLDLDMARIKLLKPLTEELVMEFAHAARKGLGATWGIAELGAAGPAGTPYGHPAGSSVIGISGPQCAAKTVVTQSENREENMSAFSIAALQLFEEVLQAN